MSCAGSGPRFAPTTWCCEPSTRRGVRVEGEHYRVVGAKRGPEPAHDIGLWLGAYKPRMLRLTGAKADGWLPSMSYLDLAEVGSLSARIDAAAAEAGRSPAEIRRLLNVEEGIEPQRLAELTLEHGFSTFVMSVSSAEDVRRFAQETSPRVRQIVDAGRTR